MCDAGSKTCLKKKFAGGREDCTKAECCGDPDCPRGQWCIEGNVCGTKCGMEVRRLPLDAARSHR